MPSKHLSLSISVQSALRQLVAMSDQTWALYDKCRHDVDQARASVEQHRQELENQQKEIPNEFAVLDKKRASYVSQRPVLDEILRRLNSPLPTKGKPERAKYARTVLDSPDSPVKCDSNTCAKDCLQKVMDAVQENSEALDALNLKRSDLQNKSDQLKKELADLNSLPFSKHTRTDELQKNIGTMKANLRALKTQPAWLTKTFADSFTSLGWYQARASDDAETICPYFFMIRGKLHSIQLDVGNLLKELGEQWDIPAPDSWEILSSGDCTTILHKILVSENTDLNQKIAFLKTLQQHKIFKITESLEGLIKAAKRDPEQLRARRKSACKIVFLFSMPTFMYWSNADFLSDRLYGDTTGTDRCADLKQMLGAGLQGLLFTLVCATFLAHELMALRAIPVGKGSTLCLTFLSSIIDFSDTPIPLQSLQLVYWLCLAASPVLGIWDQLYGQSHRYDAIVHNPAQLQELKAAVIAKTVVPDATSPNPTIKLKLM